MQLFQRGSVRFESEMKLLILVIMCIAVGQCQALYRLLRLYQPKIQYKFAYHYQPQYLSQPQNIALKNGSSARKEFRSPLRAKLRFCKLKADEFIVELYLLKVHLTFFSVAWINLTRINQSQVFLRLKKHEVC